MKKIIATIIRFVMPKAIKQHEKEKKNKRAYNADIMQHLLDAEHDIKYRVNEQFGTVYTTKNAIRCANAYGITRYNSVKALKEADFK